MKLRSLSPAVLAVFLFLTGSSLLGAQAILFFEDGVWYSATVLEVITDDLDPRLGTVLHSPTLTAWHQAHADLEADALSAESISARAQSMGLPPMGRWRIWLRDPRTWMGLNRIISGLLGTFESGVVLLFAAVGIGTLHIWSRHRSRGESSETPASYD